MSTVDVGSRAKMPVFIGRDDEVSFLTEALRGDVGGMPTATAIVAGEPGIGKSSLIRHVVENVAALGTAVVLWATGDDAESNLDFGVIDQFLSAGRARLGVRATPASLAGLDALDVGAALVRIADQITDGRVEHGRLLFVIDDAQVADERSLEALAFAARRLTADRAAVLLATRPEGIRRIPAGLTRLAQDHGLLLTLEGFDVAEVQQLVTAVHQREISVDAAQRLHRHTEGHPLQTRVLLDHLGVGDLDEEAPVVQSLSRMTLDRLVRSSPPARALLEGLAVLNAPSPMSVAAELAEIDDPLAAVVELAESGLIDVVDRPIDGEGTRSAATAVLAVRHQLIRSAVYDDLAADRRISLHRRAARKTDGPSALRHRVAAASAPDPGLVADLISQADDEAARGALQIAAEHLFTAASLADSGEAEHLVLRGADHLMALGRPFAARLDEVTHYPASALRSSVLGRASMAAGRFAEAKALLEDAWDRAEADPAGADSDTVAVVAESLSVIALSEIDADAVVLWGERVAATGTAALATTMICHGLALRGGFEAAYGRADDDMRRASPSRHHVAEAQMARGIVCAWSNRLEEARRDLSALVGGSGRRSLLQSLSARAHLADVHLRDGRLTEAVDMVTDALTLLEDSSATWLTPLPHSIASYVYTVSGDFERAADHAAVASRFARATAHAPAMIWSEAAWLRLAHAKEDSHEVARIGDGMLAAGLDEVAEGINHWRAAYIEALAMTGRTDDAVRVLDVLDAQLSEGDDASVATEVERARAVLAIAMGEPDAAIAAIEHGLSIDPVLARPLPRALLELTAGGILRRAGHRTAAAEHLQHASRRLQGLGAQPWWERCAQELAVCGLRPMKRSTPGAAAELTPQERTVARLVAQGHSNRQVADELYLSVKTVEYHLSRIYAKLGVRGRLQMATVLPSVLA